MYLIYMILGGIAAIYYIILIAYAGAGAAFSPFWLASAVVLWLIGVAFSLKNSRFRAFYNRFLFVQVFIVTSFILGAAVFAVTEGFILSRYQAAPEEECDYLIVLGCKVRTDLMTKTMRYRLDTALDYALEHPDTKLVLSGGQGADEDICEADAMRDYLVDHGIASERLILERHARDTIQNLKFSYALIKDRENARIGIVTNGFHTFRAELLARKLGMHLEGLSAPSDPIMLPNNLMREFFALGKEKLAGNI